MKKAGNIIMVLFLVIATGGVPFTRHYCGSSAGSFSVFSTPKPCCEGHCDQCHNVFTFTKVSDDFEAGSSITGQSLIHFVTLQPAIFNDLFDNVLISNTDDQIIHRKFLIAWAGPSPASLGNFRC